MKTETPHPKNVQIRLSVCCNGNTGVVPGGLFDRSFVYCKNCNKECEYVWMPMYYEVSKGTWRKIDYSIQIF